MMLTIEITNDQTGTDESANYTYVVRVNGRIVDEGTIEGHNRADNWKALVSLMIRPEYLPADSMTTGLPIKTKNFTRY